MKENLRDIRLKIRLEFPDGQVFGPGKADLLRHISDSGSIAAASRQMGMSYKRAWTLVSEMNALFANPLVKQNRGGKSGGGAALTADGSEVLRLYDAMLRKAPAATSNEIAELIGRTIDISGEK